MKQLYRLIICSLLVGAYVNADKVGERAANATLSDEYVTHFEYGEKECTVTLRNIQPQTFMRVLLPDAHRLGALQQAQWITVTGGTLARGVKAGLIAGVALGVASMCAMIQLFPWCSKTWNAPTVSRST